MESKTSRPSATVFGPHFMYSTTRRKHDCHLERRTINLSSRPQIEITPHESSRGQLRTSAGVAMDKCFHAPSTHVSIGGSIILTSRVPNRTARPADLKCMRKTTNAHHYSDLSPKPAVCRRQNSSYGQFTRPVRLYRPPRGTSCVLINTILPRTESLPALL